MNICEHILWGAIGIRTITLQSVRFQAALPRTTDGNHGRNLPMQSQNPFHKFDFNHDRTKANPELSTTKRGLITGSSNT